MIRVMTADDHAIVRKGIRALIAESSGLEVVAEAGDGQEAVQRAEETRPDVVLIDLLMPATDGMVSHRSIRPSPASCRRRWRAQPTFTPPLRRSRRAR